MGVEPLDLRRSALIVWDMQNGIASRASNRAEIVPRIKVLLAQYRAHHMPVVFSQHTTLPDGWANPTMARAMARQGMPPGSFRLAPGEPAWEILPDLAPLPTEPVLSKTAPSFFVGTPFESMLRFRGIDTLVLTGVSTERGIMGTARDAATHGFFPLIVEDGVGSMTPEGNAAALEQLKTFADVESAAAIVARLPGP
jgi:nicotinamidase-related amidase